ncbi:MAG TPA: L,D-transpeptidase family protein [Beijerinckiaceae bacterium]|nr:L,D-transpeptidase family protein [Beijerinckiaceae bacterium]
MHRLCHLSIVGFAGLGFCVAAAAEPRVITGIGPESAPAYRGPPAQATAASSAYGGGFLELLMTGHDPTPRLTTRALPVARPMPVPSATSSPVVGPVSFAAPPSNFGGAHGVDPKFNRQEVDYAGPEKAGTVIVDPESKFLFLVLADGRAMRYGIGVGREGFEWHGTQTISRKAEWPGWTPPPEMRERQPYLPIHMDGGPDNPLGARALYLGNSLYRIHGTNQPETIGKNVSSGCIRMMNEDVIDLYGRVPVGTKVIVL